MTQKNPRRFPRTGHTALGNDIIGSRTYDRALLQAAHEGDPNAFGYLYDLWFDTLHDLAHQIVDDTQLAAEVVGEVFYTTWHRLDQILSTPTEWPGPHLYDETRALSIQSVVRPLPGTSYQEIAHAASRISDITDPTAMETDQLAAHFVATAARSLGNFNASLLNLHLRHELTPHDLGAMPHIALPPKQVERHLSGLLQRFSEAMRAQLLWAGDGPANQQLRQALTQAGTDAFDAHAFHLIRNHIRSSAEGQRLQAPRLAPHVLYASIPIPAVSSALKQTIGTSLLQQGVPLQGSIYELSPARTEQPHPTLIPPPFPVPPVPATFPVPPVPATFSVPTSFYTTNTAHSPAYEGNTTAPYFEQNVHHVSAPPGFPAPPHITSPRYATPSTPSSHPTATFPSSLQRLRVQSTQPQTPAVAAQDNTADVSWNTTSPRNADPSPGLNADLKTGLNADFSSQSQKTVSHSRSAAPPTTRHDLPGHDLPGHDPLEHDLVDLSAFWNSVPSEAAHSQHPVLHSHDKPANTDLLLQQDHDTENIPLVSQTSSEASAQIISPPFSSHRPPLIISPDLSPNLVRADPSSGSSPGITENKGSVPPFLPPNRENEKTATACSPPAFFGEGFPAQEGAPHKTPDENNAGENTEETHKSQTDQQTAEKSGDARSSIHSAKEQAASQHQPQYPYTKVQYPKGGRPENHEKSPRKNRRKLPFFAGRRVLASSLPQQDSETAATLPRHAHNTAANPATPDPSLPNPSSTNPPSTEETARSLTPKYAAQERVPKEETPPSSATSAKKKPRHRRRRLRSALLAGTASAAIIGVTTTVVTKIQETTDTPVVRSESATPFEINSDSAGAVSPVITQVVPRKLALQLGPDGSTLGYSATRAPLLIWFLPKNARVHEITGPSGTPLTVSPGEHFLRICPQPIENFCTAQIGQYMISVTAILEDGTLITGETGVYFYQDS